MTPVKCNGTYYAFWTCTPGYCTMHPKATRHKASLRTGDKREAQARCADLAKRLDAERARNALGLPQPGKSAAMTLQEYLEEYRETAQRDKAKSTQKNEDCMLRTFMSYAKNPLLKDIDQRLMEGYKQHRLRSVAPRTWNSELATLKAIFGWGLTRKPPYFPEHPCSGVTRVDKGVPTIQKYVAPDEVQAALSYANEFWGNVLEFLRVTWCRSGELRSLKWSNVYWGAGYLEFLAPKERRVKRLPLSSPIIGILNTAKRLDPTSEYVFSRNGKPLSKSMLHKEIRALGRKAGVKLSPHMLRHSGITNALAHGASLFAVQAVAGHSNITTTQGYEHTALATKSAAMEIVADLGRTKLLPPASN